MRGGKSAKNNASPGTAGGCFGGKGGAGGRGSPRRGSHLLPRAPWPRLSPLFCDHAGKRGFCARARRRILLPAEKREFPRREQHAASRFLHAKTSGSFQRCWRFFIDIPVFYRPILPASSSLISAAVSSAQSFSISTPLGSKAAITSATTTSTTLAATT